MLRPYEDLYEFRKDFKIGEIVSIKNKKTERIFNVMYLGDSFRRNDSNFKVFDVEINLGGKWFSLEELFNDYEYFCWDIQEGKNILKPFGI